MDELTFRRSIYADPNSQQQEILDAKNADPSKQQLANELAQLDQQIAQALNVPVPEQLAEKLILRQALTNHQHNKRKGRIQLAMAASVALVFGFFLNSILFTSAYSTLGEHAIAHVEHEYFTNDASNTVSLASLNEKMASFGGYFDQAKSKLISAEFCWFDGMRSLHLVFQGESSPITVFVTPKNDDLRFTETFSKNSLRGKSMQFKQANVIVVAEKSEAVDVWQQQLAKMIHWQA